jgi:putative protein-disulfide isomerase
MSKYFISFMILLVLGTGSSMAQTKKQKMKQEATINPLLCDPEQGICEVPAGKAASELSIKTTAINKPVRIIYYTDPICSSCWGIEPQLRKLKMEYGDLLEVEYRMGGLLPSWDIYNSGGISKPSDVAHHWDEVSPYYDMPIIGDVWLEDPLPSSYPPSIAFKAAELQDMEKAQQFMRRIREMVFLEKKNITRWEHLQQAALETGLDTGKLKSDFDTKAEALFLEDLALAKQSGVRGFPTMFFTDTLGNRFTVYGSKPYEAYEQALLKLVLDAKKKPFDTSWEHLFRHYPTLTTREFSVLSGMGKPEAEVLLNELHQQKKLSKVSTRNGALWKRAA